MPVTTRPLIPQDRPEWEVLYAGYAAFYKVTQTAEMRAIVWGWLMDAGHSTSGLAALDDAGKLIGITHFRPYARPLAAAIGGFLDDLFVSSAARGTGAADALINAVADHGRAHGWTVIRWITADDNYRARAVYDKIAERTKWVTYDIKL